MNEDQIHGSDIPEEWMKSSDEREVAAVDRVDTILSKSPFSPRELLEFLEKDTFLRAQYSKDAGVHEGYTIEQHTMMVIGQFEKYFAHSPLPAQTTAASMRLLLAFHDIGKAIAIEKGSKENQHIETVEIIKRYYRLYQRSPEETALALAMVHNDLLGNLLRNKLYVETVATAIDTEASQLAIVPSEFLNLLVMFHQVDAGSYTKDSGGKGSLDRLFIFNPAAGRMEYSRKLQEKIEMLRQVVDQRSRESINIDTTWR